MRHLFDNNAPSRTACGGGADDDFATGEKLVTCPDCRRLIVQRNQLASKQVLINPRQVAAINRLLKVIDTIPECRMEYAAVLCEDAARRGKACDTPIVAELREIGQAHSELAASFNFEPL